MPKWMSEDVATRCAGGLAQSKEPGRGAEDERDIAGPTTSFGELLSCLRLAVGMSQNARGLAAGVDASYINRLERGERSAPSREVIMALARVLDVTPVERDRLLWTAGYLPFVYRDRAEPAPPFGPYAGAHERSHLGAGAAAD